MYAIIAVLLILAVWIDNRKNVKVGNLGEHIVKSKLELLGDDYIVLNNVRFRKVQIDHMVICRKVNIIFVIETKMWGGIITGGKDDKRWLQDKSGQVKYLNNPLLQNNYHCRVVRVKYKGYSVRSIVVFVGNKNIPPSRCIVRENDLVDYIIGITSRVYNRGIIDGESDRLSIWRKPR